MPVLEKKQLRGPQKKTLPFPRRGTNGDRSHQAFRSTLAKNKGERRSERRMS